MPKIKIDHVVSFSSEDTKDVASNVLTSDSTKKWRCKTPGERSAVIVLQLEKASVISGIDIGNEHSAYVEILVTRSEASDDYKVLLIMTPFMTPLECRQSTNVNQVKMFKKEHFTKPECDQKWDRVKINCTQPFNRHVQYGLSFVNLYTLESNGSTAKTVQTIGDFKLKGRESPEFSIGSIFEKKKHDDVDRGALSPAVAIRTASANPSPAPKKTKIIITPRNSSSNSKSEDIKPKMRNRNELLYSKDDDTPNDKIDKIIKKRDLEKEAKKKEAENGDDDKSASKSKKQTPKKDVGESSKRKSESSGSSNSKKFKSTVPQKPFGKLLEGVTVVISGIQNPDRANLRTMALEMGAKYKPDWDNTCTHLICAFVNTPKFNQVKGKGKIVKKDWIEECHRKRKRFPWRRFCLDRHDSKKPESEDEIWEELEEKKEESPISNQESSDNEGYDDKAMQKEIEEIRSKKLQKEEEAKKKPNESVFDLDTDDELPIGENGSTNADFPDNLLDIFDSKAFFIDESLDAEVYAMIKRYILAYKGTICDTLSSHIDFYITTEENVSILRENDVEALFVRPDWIWDCHNSQRFVDITDYKL